MQMEKRGWVRVPFNGRAIITKMGKPVEWGVIRNLSVNGVSVDMHRTVHLFDLLDLQLFLGKATYGSGIGTKGIVMRCDHEGIGVRLTGLNYEAFKLLSTAVRYLASDETASICQFLRDMKILEFPAPGRRQKSNAVQTVSSTTKEVLLR